MFYEDHEEEQPANLTDSNGAPLHAGDIVEISGGYFKNSNGLFFITREPTPGRATLQKLTKAGKLTTSGGVEFWPLSSYCSDRRKNAEARRHNSTHARIEKRENVTTWFVGEWFRKQGTERTERAERNARLGHSEDAAQLEQTAAEYNAIADRLQAGAAAPAVKEPQKGIRFYWNGVKVDGGRLIPCWYSLDPQSVTITARDYKDLPRQWLPVKNDSDIMTDYFCNDSATLTPSHPLYKFARYAALKCLATGHSYRKLTEEQSAEWAQMKDPGQPTAADLAAVEQRRIDAEAAAKAAEEAEREAARAEVQRQKEDGKQYIETTAAAHPIQDGAPYVVIEWSEHPAFYSWEDGELKLSVAAAEIILKHYDDERIDKPGYDKTKFTIHYTENGEECTYTGRYDLGDGDGGLIQHIKGFAEWDAQHAKTEEEREHAAARLAFAEMLQEYTAAGRVVSVEVAPWAKEAIAKAQQQRQEQARQDWEDIRDTVSMLTEEQLAAAVMLIDPKDSEKSDVARFFLQELSSRDRNKALEVFRLWRDMGKDGAA